MMPQMPQMPQANASQPAVLDRERPEVPVPPRPSWAPLLASVGATVVLIGLLAGLLAARALPRSPASAAHPTATPATTTTPQGSGQWQSIDSYAHVAGLVLAPSDPRTAYQSLLSSSKTAPSALTLQRTRDAGANWQSVTVPTRLKGVNADGYAYAPSFTVSPLNDNLVYLTVAVHLTTCPNRIGQEGAPSALTAPQPSAAPCFLQFVSADGGTTWKDLSLPLSGLLGAPQVQGTRLWALISQPSVTQDTTAPAGHLARSTDGGITWTVADASLSSSVGIADFMPAPIGATIFIVTDRSDRFNAGICQTCLPPPQYRLWRSDDLGAHWSQVSTLPYVGIAGLAVAQNGASAEPVIYLQAFTDDHGTLALVASGDGGKTWAPAPTAGLQAGSVQVHGLPGELADGSVILICEPSGRQRSHTFYAWKQGDASWRPIAPELASLVVAQLIVSAPAADGSQTLTLLYQDENGNLVATYQVH